MKEKRKDYRKKVPVTTIIRKPQPESGYSIMQFQSGDLSMGGVFICTENLGLLDLGEEVDVLVDRATEKYYEGKARVVRSARIFSVEGNQIESGYGLMFLNPDEAFKGLLVETLNS